MKERHTIVSRLGALILDKPDTTENTRSMRFNRKQCVILSMLLCAFAFNTQSMERDERKEDEFNDSLCSTIKGDREVKHNYTYGKDEESYVAVDCETDEFVIEGGLDHTRSSLDSLQQALFFSVLTEKDPAVVIYDTDKKFGKFEYRIQEACEKVGVLFVRLNFNDTRNLNTLIALFSGSKN